MHSGKIYRKLNKLEKSKLNLEEFNVSTNKVQHITIPYIKKISEIFGKNLTKILDLIGIKTGISFEIISIL